MGNSLRCCLACVLPCGALDLIRIVHLNGVVEEITRPVTAGEVLKNYPNHVLSKPCCQGVVRRILILSNSSELKRGSIYFLIPASSVPENKRHPPAVVKDGKKAAKKVVTAAVEVSGDVSGGGDGLNAADVVVVVAEIKKKLGHRRARRRIQAGEWQPHLESIFEE